MVQVDKLGNILDGIIIVCFGHQPNCKLIQTILILPYEHNVTVAVATCIEANVAFKLCIKF